MSSRLSVEEQQFHEEDVEEELESQQDSDATEVSSSHRSSDLIIEIRRPTVEIITKFAINIFFPLLNGMMLGFGEILAHELGFRWGWYGSRVSMQQLVRFYKIIICTQSIVSLIYMLANVRCSSRRLAATLAWT
jgi:hypothetical protein